MRLYDLQSSSRAAVLFATMTELQAPLEDRHNWVKVRVEELCANGLIWFGNEMSQFWVTSLRGFVDVTLVRSYRCSVGGGMITSFGFGQIAASCTGVVCCCVLQIGHLLADRRAGIHLFRHGGDKHKALIMFTCSERETL